MFLFLILSTAFFYHCFILMVALCGFCHFFSVFPRSFSVTAVVRMRPRGWHNDPIRWPYAII